MNSRKHRDCLQCLNTDSDWFLNVSEIQQWLNAGL